MRRVAGALLAAASLCAGQVKLNVQAQPPTGYAGVTVENLTGSGFPAGTIDPANVSVWLATSCGGAVTVRATPTSIVSLIGSSRKVSFAVPGTAKAGSYAVWITGQTGTGKAFTSSSCSSLTVNAQSAFVKASGGELTLNGQPFRFGGGNSYELMYSAHSTIDQVLQTAVSNQFRVVRTWGWIDIGNADGSNSVRGPANGYYFHYWNGSAPAFNDGANGLENLDYVIYRAGQLGLKLIIPFTNNWTDFGGMDQYIKWAGLQYHDQFYTDSRVRGWYEEWISHLLNRVNTYNGLAYKDDPTILTWELSNEPRCSGSGPSGNGYPSSNSCTTQTITEWVAATAAYIKGIDRNHLLSVGDEGFFCNPSAGPGDWIENCSQGVDSVAFAQTSGIDLMGFHLYPEGWGQSASWSEQYIDQHVADGKAIGKPAYLGEFGLLAGNTRNVNYRDWTARILSGQGAGALFWDLAVGKPGAAAAEANNSFDLYDGAPLLGTLRNYAQTMAANTELVFPPVADDQWATTPYNQPTTLNPLEAVVTYGGATVESGSIDLDPATPGVQSTAKVYGGTFAVSGDAVQFTPDSNFNGNAQAAYVVADTNHRLSNTAYLNVQVSPSEGATLLLESFETGTDGWGPISAGGGTVAQSTKFPTDGTHSLMVSVANSGWFGVSFPSAVDLSNRPSLSIDVETTSIGGSAAIAFQSGSGYTWCQTADPWPTLSTNSLNTVTIPLVATSLNCGGGTPDLTQVHTVYLYLTAPGSYYLDKLRAAAVSNSKAPIEIESFEAGTDGWAPLHGSASGSVSQTNAYHTDGQYSLKVQSLGSGDWFGRNLPNTLNVAGKTALRFDIDAVTNGSGVNVSIQSGSGWQWCQGNSWPYVSGSNSTVTVQFSDMSCAPDLTQIHAIWIFMNAGTYDVDNVRAE